MNKINFTKMVASGNDFVIAEIKNQKSKIKNLNTFAKEICDRKFGIGADGLVVLEKSKVADIKMRIFNADGSEAEMCGNGARCMALFVASSKRISIETKAGIIDAEVDKDAVKIKLTEPKDLKLDIPIKIGGRSLKVNFINSGVPHAVIFVEGLDKIDVVGIGRQIRFHRKFAPAGTNVNFVEVCANDSIKVRTYERGVEDETLACGTGSVASAIIATGKLANWQTGKHEIKVITQSTEILKVYFTISKRKINNVWLEGKANIVYRGVYYV